MSTCHKWQSEHGWCSDSLCLFFFMSVTVALIQRLPWYKTWTSSVLLISYTELQAVTFPGWPWGKEGANLHYIRTILAINGNSLFFFSFYNITKGQRLVVKKGKQRKEKSACRRFKKKILKKTFFFKNSFLKKKSQNKIIIK